MGRQRIRRAWCTLALFGSTLAYAADPWPMDGNPPATNTPAPTAPRGETRFYGQPATTNGGSARNNARRSLASDPGTGINQSEAANVTQAAATPDATSWWAPHLYKYFIGYEGSIPVIGGRLLTNNAVAVGYWMGPHWGLEFFFGYSRANGTYTESTSTATNAITNSQTIASTYAGDLSVPQLSLGVGPKYRFYQNDWVQIAFGLVAVVTPPTSTTYSNGSRTVAINNLDSPDTQTVNEAAYGQKQLKQDWMLEAGPRLNAEFYLKWFPHLALGLETGILGTFGGYVTTTTNLRTRSYNVVNGVEQPAGADSSTVAQSTPKPGIRAGTFGLGGGTFAFTGYFTVRYVW